MRGGTAVCVDDDLATREAAIALGAPDHKATGRVDQKLHITLEQFLGKHGLDDLLDHSLSEGLEPNLRVVLGGQDHGVKGHGPAILVAKRDL